MTPSKWLVAGLVAAALLFLAGLLTGHWNNSTSDADRQVWQDSTNVLLGAQRGAHRREVEQLMAQAEADSFELSKYRKSANQERQQRIRWQAEADTLTAMLAFAETAADSIPIYQGIVASGDSALQHEIGRGDSLTTALDLSEQSTGVLHSVITIKDTRITVLEQQLQDAPKAQRWRLRLIGVDLRPAVFAGIQPGGGVTVGAGVAITP